MIRKNLVSFGGGCGGKDDVGLMGYEKHRVHGVPVTHSSQIC